MDLAVAKPPRIDHTALDQVLEKGRTGQRAVDAPGPAIEFDVLGQVEGFPDIRLALARDPDHEETEDLHVFLGQSNLGADPLGSDALLEARQALLRPRLDAKIELSKPGLHEKLQFVFTNEIDAGQGLKRDADFAFDHEFAELTHPFAVEIKDAVLEPNALDAVAVAQILDLFDDLARRARSPFASHGFVNRAERALVGAAA